MKVDVGSNGDKGHTRQKEDEVDEKDNVTEHCVTTTHFESCKVKAQIIFTRFFFRDSVTIERILSSSTTFTFVMLFAVAQVFDE